MAREDSLASVLSEFARTLVTDFPIQAILDHLVERIVTVLPISGAGVTLISPGIAPHYVAASDATALQFEQLQTELGQGPCVLAYESGQAVPVPDLAHDNRFPEFRPAALALGMAAVFTFPLRHGKEQLGALDLYRDKPGELDEQEMVAAQTLADVASAYILNAQAREEALNISDRFRESALHDALTGLPNRVLLHQRLEHAALRAQRSHSSAAVLFVDLDRFKRVNDTYGHAAGDALLVGVAQRLSAAIRPGDTLARVSGDEFVILCEELAHVRDAEHLATRIGDAFREPFRVEHATVKITASVGIAYAGPGEDVSGQLVVHADTAMYQAKRRGGAAHHVVDLREAEQDRVRNDLEHELRAALAESRLGVLYQPIVQPADGVVVGVEALLRWTHPELGPVPAMTSISAAEQSGLIDEIGAWVLTRACHDRVAWLRTHPDRPLRLSVNVSARQLMGPGFRDTVAACLVTTAMDPTALILEATEGIFIEDGDRAVMVLADLKALGLQVALDDFGTGYCSLNYLRKFPVDSIKIDRAFITDLDHNVVDREVVASVTNLAHVLGMTVTAEGVETRTQRDHIIDMGCEYAQGYLYARPVSAHEISHLLGSQPGKLLQLPLGAPMRPSAAVPVAS